MCPTIISLSLCVGHLIVELVSMIVYTMLSRSLITLYKHFNCLLVLVLMLLLIIGDTLHWSVHTNIYINFHDGNAFDA